MVDLNWLTISIYKRQNNRLKKQTGQQFKVNKKEMWTITQHVIMFYNLVRILKVATCLCT